MRTVYVTNGYGPDTVVVDVPGTDLTGATLHLALAPEAQDAPPAVSDLAWRPVAAAEDRSLTLVVDSTTAPGHYHVWLQITIGSATLPFRVLDVDGRPLHVLAV